MQGLRNHGALSWTVTTLTVGYLIWIGVTLTERVASFAGLFTSLGAELPVPTRLAIGASQPLIVWSLVAVATIVLLANQMRTTRPHVQLAVSVTVFMVTAVLASLITEAMFAPLLQLIRQIG